MSGKKQKVLRFWDRFNEGDMAGALGILPESIVFTVSGTTPFSGVLRGKEELTAHMTRFAALLEPGANMQAHELIEEGDVVVSLNTGTMRTLAGLDYNNSYAFVFRFAGDEIASITEYLDTALVETALCEKTIG